MREKIKANEINMVVYSILNHDANNYSFNYFLTYPLCCISTFKDTFEK